ncbi:mCG1027867, partial [Mus musculus]
RTACEKTGLGADSKELGCVGLCRRCFRLFGRKLVPVPVSSLPCSFFSRTHTLLSDPRSGKAGPFETSFCKQISLTVFCFAFS